MCVHFAFQPDLKRDWKNFCDYIKDKCSQLDMDKTKVKRFSGCCSPLVAVCCSTVFGINFDVNIIKSTVVIVIVAFVICSLHFIVIMLTLLSQRMCCYGRR